MKLSAEQKTLDLGPGAIAEVSTSDNARAAVFGATRAAAPSAPNFVLSNEEWITIQLYATRTLALPNTKEKLKKFLGDGAPADLSDFNDLIDAYAAMNQHVTKWQKETFPASVSLASDVYNYSLKVATYYAPILPLAERLTIDPDDEAAKKKLSAILTTLSKDAADRAKRAADVADMVKEFAIQTKNDKIVLTGVDGKSGLNKKYEDKYGAKSATAKQLAKEIIDMQKLLDQANKDYNYDVKVAATTPTYFWVFPPLGLIAASVVAGVYGDRAVKALDSIKSYRKKIETLKSEEAANTLLLTALGSTNKDMADIVQSINAALPLIQKIQGSWQAIAIDLADIVKTIDANIAKALPIIMDLGVETAIVQWTNVGKAADRYRQNAYVTVQQ